MPVYLNESEFGVANDVVGFPHLLVCLGFLALTGNAMYGMHSDIRAESGALAMELRELMRERGVNDGDIVRLYGCCNLRKRYEFGDLRKHWEIEMRELALACNFHGPVGGFDTGIIAPQDGTYVEYRPQFNQGRCKIFYKRNEKMNYQRVPVPRAAVNPDIRKLHGLVPRNVGYETISSDVIATQGNRGRLHEVDYAQRLFAFNV